MKNLYLIFLFSILTSSILTAQDATFTVKVSTDSLLMDNYVEVSFTLKNATAANFQPPSFEGFTVISGPSQASSFSSVNGVVTQSVTYSYHLMPIDIGNYYIDPASIETDSNVLETAPIEIIVHPNPDGIIQNKPNQNRSFFGGFGGFNFGTPIPPTPPKPPTKPKKKRKIYRM